MPDRVLGAATIAGVGPYNASGLDWAAGMGEDNVVEYGLAADDPDKLFEWMQPHVQALAAATPEAILSSIGSLISKVDEASLTGEFAEEMAASFARAFENGAWGWYDDDLAIVAPWGFDLEAITVPISIWQGDQDLMVPPSHGHWLAANIPTAQPQLRPEHGHLSLAVGAIGEIFDGLRDAALQQG
jgi:pimeloyl-ACP methyl ester carboxylesterase